ncbi:iron-siderophore ABC transporter substrate-binding protein [Corynebacterium suicordis]|nr:iron-siderophore ABC transporter substrate-binding protein [Corynebacterium suicordis]MDR6276820.1 iron complex transport system substrate-binding protein [Corynebacterium suicordis]
MTRFELDRRSFFRLSSMAALATTGAVVLSACGDGGSGPEVKGEARTVKDINDQDVQVPAKPERVVSLSEPTLDSLLALGITPIGAVTGRGQSSFGSYLGNKAEGIEVLGTVAQPNFEAIGAAKPDLILVDGTSINNNQPVIDSLKQIAPVVMTGNAGGNWRTNFELVADAVNLADKGKQVISDYEARTADMHSKLGEYTDSTFSIVRWEGNSAALILKELPAGVALTDLGLKRPANQDREGRGHSEPVSAENLRDIDADYIFFGTLGGSSVANPEAGGTADTAAAEAALAQAEATAGFPELKAYKEDHIYPVDGSAWTSTGGPLLMNRILDDIHKLLIEKA